MSRQPNVLFLIADDHRASAIGAFGDPTVRTPTLDQLCSEGTSFRQNCHMGGVERRRLCADPGLHSHRRTCLPRSG